MMEAGFPGYKVNMTAMPVVHWATSESPINSLENEIIFTTYYFYRIKSKKANLLKRVQYSWVVLQIVGIVFFSRPGPPSVELLMNMALKSTTCTTLFMLEPTLENMKHLKREVYLRCIQEVHNKRKIFQGHWPLWHRVFWAQCCHCILHTMVKQLVQPSWLFHKSTHTSKNIIKCSKVVFEQKIFNYTSEGDAPFFLASMG